MTQKGTAEQVVNTQAELREMDNGSCGLATNIPTDDDSWYQLNIAEWILAGLQHGWTPAEVATLIDPDEWSETAAGDVVKAALAKMG